MNIAEIIGRNIDKARQEKEISHQELAQILGVTRQTVSKYIKGEQAIDSEKLFKLAAFFNKPFDYFIEENEDEVLRVMFRADFPDDNFTDELRAVIQDRLQKQWEVLSLAGQDMISFLPPQYKLKLSGKKNLTDKEKEEIERVALEQRQQVLDNCGHQDIYECFEAFGIQVIAQPFHNSNIFGLSGYSDEHGAFIIINDDDIIPEERKIFTLIHEYGHLVFHREEYGNNAGSHFTARSDPREKMADHFAGCFLAPRYQVQHWYKRIGNRATLTDLIEFKKELGISLQALVMTLKNYGFFDSSQVSRFYKIINSRGGKKKEPNPISAIEKNKTYYILVRNLFMSDAISTGRIAELLGISMKDARKQASSWMEEFET
ncbi:MAG: XRE family transcriptional regulator [Syntrophomonas sp.]|uniref:helix-turn-helix domain-containing protein n=1 Tax=Syntrophomonas sp. TaxID=2053627 RepID=UPI00261EF6D6|nr:XRE family transcriptional regulator [Syntrophomonas sp.]MDD2509916.1 XRE family transcriptional regulator [Syntrophomonas sp.]MDD3878674.1 XRE family transcriptional regulator [Syntrophomonas sp.]MDD4626044.1 XRE family transcriptional regulator [Syntrophomonas sp.]